MRNSDNRPRLSRRAFLKVSAGAVAASGIAWPKKAKARSTGKLATLIDLSLCDGCPGLDVPACVSACKTINRDKIPPVADPIPVPWPRKTVEDWSRRREVSDRLTPYNYLYVHRAEVDVDGVPKTLFVPRRCMHCDNPACATICPFAANHKHENGAVVIDQDLCFGGAKCKAVCPWEIPQRQSGVGIYLHVLPDYMGNGVMYKCDLCHDRLAQGHIPACVEACEKRLGGDRPLYFGTREEMTAMARKRAEAVGGQIYGEKENGGTSTLYVSRIPFERIDARLQDKKSALLMGKVRNGLDEVNRWAHAFWAAPAVLSAGAVGLVLRRRRNGGKEGD